MQLTQVPINGTKRNLSLLGAFCFFLSAIEYMIPKPLPFLRIGLANLPLLLALDLMPFPSFLLLAAVKISGQALISGALFSYVFLLSAGGTLASATLMYALRRAFGKEKLSLAGTGAAGALASNGVQLVLAYFFALGSGVRYAAVPVLALGLVTGTLLGAVSEYFIRRSLWYAQMKGAKPKEDNKGVIGDIGMVKETAAVPLCPATQNYNENPLQRFRKKRESFCRNTFSPGELALAGLCMAPALLLNPGASSRIIQFLFFFFIAWLFGKKTSPLVTLSVMAGIIFFNLIIPYGEVLFTLGPMKITEGALKTGVQRAVTLEGLFMLSRACVSSKLALPGAFGEIVGESFRIFSGLAEEKKSFNARNWTERLDELLISGAAYPETGASAGANLQSGEQVKKEPEKTGTASGPSRPPNKKRIIQALGPKIFLAALVFLAWLPLVIAS